MEIRASVKNGDGMGYNKHKNRIALSLFLQMLVRTKFLLYQQITCKFLDKIRKHE